MVGTLSLFAVLFAASAPVAAGWGICSGEDVGCLGGDYFSCTSTYSKSLGCKWFDFGGLVAGVVVMGVLLLVSLFMLYGQRSEISTLRKKVAALEPEPAAAGAEGSAGGDASTPLIREPQVPTGGNWGRVGL